LENYRTLGPTGRRVLRTLARRLADGKRTYQDDFGRDAGWTDEALSEVLDGMVYLGIAIAKRSEAGG
jgi:hypothetical protein